MSVLEVTTLDLAELEPYRTMRRPQEHIQQGIFVAEGEKVVRRLLASGLRVQSLLLTPEWLRQLNSAFDLRDVACFVAGQKLVETIVGYRLHQGVMAVGRVPVEPDLKTVLAGVPHPYLFVALDGITSAENVGVIVRNSVAFGADAILADRTSASPYLRRAVRNSMGSVFRVPVLHVDLPDLFPMEDCRVICATPKGSQSIREVDLSGNVCVVFGNEGTGVSPIVLAKCNQRVAIPMKNDTDSLNVASASAVFLHELSRRRQY